MADYRQADLDEARKLAGHCAGSKTLERIARALAARERKGAESRVPRSLFSCLTCGRDRAEHAGGSHSFTAPEPAEADHG